MCNAPWYCPVNKHWIINLRISAGSRGLLSDTLMSSNKNNDLTRCNCYCNNSWTRRILITADSDSDATTLLKVRSLLRQAGTCQGPGASHHGLLPGPRGLANIELQRGGGGRPHSTQAPEIKLWRRVCLKDSSRVSDWRFHLTIFLCRIWSIWKTFYGGICSSVTSNRIPTDKNTSV